MTKISRERDLPFWVALAHHPDIGAATFQKLLARFPNMRSAWGASRSELEAAGLTHSAARAVFSAHERFDPERVTHQLRRLDIGFVTLQDDNYPKLLRELPDPPAVLFCRGQFIPSEGLLLSIVGSRKYSLYGKRVTESLVPRLVEEGVTVVSGLALGIDSIAHRATLDAGGRTIAVLGCGLDKIYPAAHASLAKEIVDRGGLLISEFPPKTPSYPSNFPVRNRIIAGLTLGTVVVEAAIDSGSLLTAKSALEYNREVFAVPGDIFRETAHGANNLLKMGAKVVTSAEDILVELAIPEKHKKRVARAVIADSPEEAILLPLLGSEPTHIDALVKASKMEVAAVGSTLILMEMKGKVKNVGGNQYMKVREW